MKGRVQIMTAWEKLKVVQTKLNAPKNRTNTFGKYKYRSCEDILEAVKPLLAEVNASITLCDQIVNVGDRYYVEASAYFHNCDDPDRFIGVDAYARETESRPGMDPAQVTGAASSYARKYALGALLLIDDQKDPDTDEFKNEADAKEKKPEKAAKKQKQADDASDLDKYVTTEQIKTLEMLLERAGVTVEKFNQIYNLAIISELPVDKYDEAVKKLETAISVKEKGAK